MFECRLKVILAERRMKQRELAEKTGVNEHTLSALVSERRPPSMEVAYKIAHALDLNVMEIWIYKPE